MEDNTKEPVVRDQATEKSLEAQQPNHGDSPPFGRKIASSRKTMSIITIASCAIANLSDGYQNSLASNMNVIFKHLIPKAYTSEVQTRISNSLLVGSVIGILILGYCSDRWSRKGGMFFTSGLVFIGSLMATLVFQVKGGPHKMMWYLTIARGIAGVGAGGEYPTSAAAALEGSNEHFDRKRGPIQVMMSTFTATFAGPLCTFIYLMTIMATGNNLSVAYHAMYGFATCLPVIILILRIRMGDALIFKKSNFKHERVPYWLVIKKYWLRLLGTSSAFFLYDFINFPNSIMSGTIVNKVVPSHNIKTVAIWQFILNVLPVPGVIVGAYLTNKIGRRWTGIIGFLGYVVFGFIVGGAYKPLTERSIPAFIVLYGLMQCMGHLGPGATIGLMSVESYPTAVRGMGYGISAAFGKAGAAVGTQVFLPIEDSAGQAATFFVAGGIGIVGALIYYFIPEGKNMDLEQEDAKFVEYLRSNGWQGKLSTVEYVEEGS
ncbi:MFS general substrate transporter [Xylona heveae TC161]|uniref:MFS general substrate transporter n=1 Tax=Xylona heveae (strain CBS 132557 / TC161) TaxID=1328760 RepID=A0A165AJY4_XYLHT|nr:MFS general substrate transporter [Xylona heveae TC161]KZF20606.1 MFS general substrate transporter [Xylona heveae TC161]